VSGPGIAAFGGKIYTFGGNRYGSRQSVIEVYDPCTNTWPPELVDHMPAAGEPWAAATLGDKIYLAGGSFQGSADHLWCYDPATRLWDTNLPKLNIPRSAHELVVVNDCLFAIGGSGPPLNSVEWWRPGDTHWTLDESLNVARGYLGAESISNTIYAFGGVESGILSSVESAVICEPTAIPVTLDIKPGSCPNPLNLNSKGVLPVAILGSADFDVNQIDIASIRLADVAPIRSSYEDVATPVSDGNECDCNTAGSDGYTDLTLKFKTQEIVEELLKARGELVEGEQLTLSLTGALSDETSIEGADCIVIVGKVPKSIGAKIADVNGDGIVNMLDIALLAKSWLESSDD
jgi:hypothetical protein